MKKIINGEVFEMTEEEIAEFENTRPPIPVESYQLAIQGAIDSAAREKQFNDGIALASYTSSTVAAWAAQAKAFVAWRDDVWQYAYSELSKVKGGVREPPSIDGFLLELPEITWPK